jgi:hypothetical protein
MVKESGEPITGANALLLPRTHRAGSLPLQIHPEGSPLGRAELERALTALGERLARRGIVADVFVVGAPRLLAIPARYRDLPPSSRSRLSIVPGRGPFGVLNGRADRGSASTRVRVAY